MDVYGLGTLAMDVLIQVDALPGEDSFCIVKSSERQPGGSGTNVIVQLARLGAKCGRVGKSCKRAGGQSEYGCEAGNDNASYGHCH